MMGLRPAEAVPKAEALEVRALVESIFLKYGFDFRDYAYASLHRRLLGCARAEGVDGLPDLQTRLLRDPLCMDRLLNGLTVHVTSMFRDPGFYLAFREKVVPRLRTYPFVRIWHAGCSTGEEVYSMAILLREENLLPRCLIYATDLSEGAVQRAKAGIFPLDAMREYTDNYIRAGGKAAFAEYYRTDHRNAILRSHLKERIVFAQHDLATDGSLNEFNVILCRNVMIYFNDSLQARVHRLFFESLARFGVLCLGRKESLRFTPFEDSYKELDNTERLFRKVC